jgi:hypothetical protein
MLLVLEIILFLKSFCSSSNNLNSFSHSEIKLPIFSIKPVFFKISVIILFSRVLNVLSLMPVGVYVLGSWYNHFITKMQSNKFVNIMGPVSFYLSLLWF